jgi:hypothetical protein
LKYSMLLLLSISAQHDCVFSLACSMWQSGYVLSIDTKFPHTRQIRAWLAFAKKDNELHRACFIIPLLDTPHPSLIPHLLLSESRLEGGE